MKYLLLVLLPIFSYAQQDSVRYEKRDTQWYKITVVEQPFTTVDSLVSKTLVNDIWSIANGYYRFKLEIEEKEKAFLTQLRRLDRDYRALTGKRPNLDSLSNAKQLIGTWLLGGVEISITKQLKLLTASINFVSEDVFWVNNNGREYFFKRGKNWVSDKRKLEPKTTRKL